MPTKHLPVYRIIPQDTDTVTMIDEWPNIFGAPESMMTETGERYTFYYKAKAEQFWLSVDSFT